MTEDEVEKIVHQTLLQMGYDPTDPEKNRKDQMYTRRQREASEKIGLALRISVYTSALGGIIGMLVMGFRYFVEQIKSGGPTP